MNKQICFIIPPSVFLLDERVFMSLGVLKLAAVVQKIYQVDVLDLSGIVNFEDVISQYTQDNKNVIYCITATTPQLPAVIKILSVIRTISPCAKTILGGPHVTLVHAAFKRECNRNIIGRAHTAFNVIQKAVDVLVCGDGEKAIFQALNSEGSAVIDADDPKSHLFLRNEDLDCLPWPARNMLDVSSYHYAIDGVSALSIVSQLGCPFGCGFCGGRNSPSLRRSRSRSMDGVVAEMEHLYAVYGVKGFMFYDDELNVNHESVIALMQGIIDLQAKLGVEFRLRGFVKSQLFNDAQAEIMYKAGFRWLLVGFESASLQMLSNMNKRSTVQENTQCIEIAKRHGLKIKALMSIGHPGESTETAMMTNDWLIKVRPDDFDITVITVYPGTPYYDESVLCDNGSWVYTRNGAKLFSRDIDYAKIADYYKGDPNGGYESNVFTEYLDSVEIVKLRNWMEKNVREVLGIPYPAQSSAIRYEHSIGQSQLPAFILQKSK